LKSFGWGLLTTAAIRSSTITTSVVVPIVAKKIATLKQAAPFIMGANIGTTITAFIAATLNSNSSSGISIAIAHFLFNFIGVILFFPIPVLKKLPMELAEGLGRLTLKYRLAGFVYLLLTFFFVPFSLIYLHQDSVQKLNLVYDQVDTNGIKTKYRLETRLNARTQTGEWTRFDGAGTGFGEEPSLIYPVSVKNNTLFVGKNMFLFNRVGFCWDSEDEKGRFTSCIENILRDFHESEIKFDSVYVCRTTYNEEDSILHRFYISAPFKIMLRHEVLSPGGKAFVAEKLVGFELE